MGDVTWDEDQIEGAFAGDLVGDVDVAATGVLDGSRAHRDRRKQSTVWSSTMPTVCMNA